MTSVLFTLGRYFALWTLALLPPPSRLRTGWDPHWSNVWGGEVKQYWRGRLGCAPFNASAVELQVRVRVRVRARLGLGLGPGEGEGEE